MKEETIKNESVGERLLALRNEKQLTQEDLAEHLEVSRQSISKWELNKTLPDVEKLIQLSELYQVSLDYLIKGKVETSNENLTEEEKDDDDEEAEESEPADEGTENIEGENAETVKPEKGGLEEKSVKHMIFLVCMLLSGVLCIGMIAFSGRLFLDHTVQLESKEQNIIHIDRIYEQYTKAEVVGVTDEGNIFKDTIWLDIPGVRQDDYVTYYYDEEQPTQIFFEYYSKTLLLPLIFGIIFLIFFIVFLTEWINTKSVAWKWRTKNEKEE